MSKAIVTGVVTSKRRASTTVDALLEIESIIVLDYKYFGARNETFGVTPISL